MRKFSWLAADVVAHGVGLSQASCNQPAYFFLAAPTFARGLQFRAQLRGRYVQVRRVQWDLKKCRSQIKYIANQVYSLPV